jgi:hypothetical protein
VGMGFSVPPCCEPFCSCSSSLTACPINHKFTIAPSLSPITASLVYSRLVDGRPDSAMVRNYSSGAFLPHCIPCPSPSLSHLPFSRKSSMVLFTTGYQQVASCCHHGGKKTLGCRFLGVGSSIAVGRAALLGPPVM